MGRPTKSDTKSADGFLNLSIEMPDGSSIRLRKGVPLDIDNRVERSLLNAATTNSDFTVKLTGSVHAIVDESEAEDIVFS